MVNVSYAVLIPLRSQLTEISGCALSLFVVCCPILASCFLGAHKGPATLRKFPYLCVCYTLVKLTLVDSFLPLDDHN